VCHRARLKKRVTRYQGRKRVKIKKKAISLTSVLAGGMKRIIVGKRGEGELKKSKAGKKPISRASKRNPEVGR